MTIDTKIVDFDYRNRVPSGARVLCAMSGGVDSSITASRLKRDGYDIVGVTMHLVDEEDRAITGAQLNLDKACCTVRMTEDSRRVASKLDFPYYVVNLTEEFKKYVVEPSRAQYEIGLTPNPCVLCNRRLKFDQLFRRADALGCDYIATGHYCRIGYDSEGYHLYRAVDVTKDQSYFLSYLTEKELSRLIFPLGTEYKENIREEARKLGLANADRPDSQDLCFLASGESPEEWANRNAVRAGKIVTVSGEVVGEHGGIKWYTVGQRKGLPGGMSEKMYVVRINPEKNEVVIGTEEDCYASEFTIEDVSMVSTREGEALPEPSLFDIQIRYHSPAVKGTVDLEKNTIRLSEPVRAITPGQTAVWYAGEELIGAGRIKSVGN